jgi:hypothetical protein
MSCPETSKQTFDTSNIYLWFSLINIPSIALFSCSQWRTYCNHGIIKSALYVLSAKVKTAILSEEQVLLVAADVLPPD